MQKKNLILVFLIVLLAGMFIYPRLSNKAEAVGISEVTADPSKYVGKTMTLSGSVQEVYTEDSVFYLADEKACCVIPVLVPFTEEQRNNLPVDALYSGTLPGTGEFLEATGTIRSTGGSYVFEIDSVKRNGQVIISRKQ